MIEESFNKVSMKRIAIFGSTGSVGVQSLSVINQNNDQFKVVCLSCNGNVDSKASLTSGLPAKQSI